ncbi:hypothetical protein ES705_31335 [subsurface metagenome]
MSNLHSPRILIVDDQDSLRKLLVKYMLKAGKKRMKMVSDVQLPQSAFLSVLKHQEG